MAEQRHLNPPELAELAAYLLSLHADAPLYEAPYTPGTTAKP